MANSGSNMRILDCTLRDGGYINDFRFGEEVIQGVVSKLTDASIDIIEVGFLKSGCFDVDRTQYGSSEFAARVIGVRSPHAMYVGMIQYGKISEEEIAPRVSDGLDGIRVTFHEHEIEPSFELGRKLKEKGYEVFMQPVGTTTYTDAALLGLVERVNQLEPYAFYLVDTLGTMYPRDALRMAYLVDNNLKPGIAVGYHSHNNLQMSFANAQRLLEADLHRDVIVDASVFGMGRGAGNLCTELIAQYANDHTGYRYDTTALLEIYDEYIGPLSSCYAWGYSAAYCMAALNNCHPNYASYLLARQTLRVRDINAILSAMPDDKSMLFDERYAEECYKGYLSRTIDDTVALGELTKMIAGRDVIVVAPGASFGSCAKEVESIRRERGLVVVSVNFVPEALVADVVFVSNLKRFDRVESVRSRVPQGSIVVATSNIETEDPEVIRVNYASYLNDDALIMDNAGLMCLNMLRTIGVRKVWLAGFDGFSKDRTGNYCYAAMDLCTDEARSVAINEHMAAKLTQIGKQMDLEFLTETAYR